MLKLSPSGNLTTAERVNLIQEFAKTDRTTLKRLRKRGVFDRDQVYSILDEGFVCHVGFVINGRPFVIPTSYGRVESNLFIHGSAASRMLRALAGRIEVCVTVTLIDGLVLARSAFHHSMNYRSVVIFGTACVVQEPREKLNALRAISEHIIPQRWQDVREPSENELKATLVLRLPLIEVSAKVRNGPPLDDEADYELDTWAGEVPLRLVAQIPIPDPRLPNDIEVPSYVSGYLRKRKDGAPAIEIRVAAPEDSEQVASVLESAFAEYRSSYTDGGFAATVITRDKVEARMNEGPMWIALQDGVIVGAVAAVSRAEALHVRGMGIVPEARGKKIGELLLKHVEEFALRQEHTRMTLNTTPFLARAIRLYEHFGFRQSDEGPSDLFGTPLFSMKKELR
jgi:nitroimidazol reductase NimA-like FMN-containing flavoprotein (pyridoxamine 5'-phosphate oxidase superfamily)/GNAT superfamily N-acetyltransferase